MAASTWQGKERIRGRNPRKGFSLIEILVATSILVLGVVSLLMATGACSRTTDGGNKLSQAVFLAQELREWTVTLPFSDPDPEDAGNPPGPDGLDPQMFVDDLDDLMGVTYSPPRDGQGYTMYNQESWAQTITLTWVHPEHLTPVSPGQTDAVQVTVDVSFDDRNVFTGGWLLIKR